MCDKLISTSKKKLNAVKQQFLVPVTVVAACLLPGFALAQSNSNPSAVKDAAKVAPIDVGAGRIAWFDITTDNLAASKEFYGKLFGWTYKPLAGSDLAVEINAGAARIGTIRVAEGKLSPFNGVVYVQVNDLTASCQKAKELGATLAPGFPFDLPGGAGSIGLAVDPAGHPFGLYSKEPLPTVKTRVKEPESGSTKGNAE